MSPHATLYRAWGSTGWTAAFLAFGSGAQGKTILIDLILPDVSTIFKKLIQLYSI